MLNNHKRQMIVTYSFLILFLILFFLLAETSTHASSVFQSSLPTPIDPHYIESFQGGLSYCGLQQSATWLSIPSGFSSVGAATFHCDLANSLSEWNRSTGAWGNRGYLVGFWPSDIPLVKPFQLTIEIDPVLTKNICKDCFIGRYFTPDTGWQPLPTTYDVDTARVYVTISNCLPASGYPGYADRFLIALFTRSTATPTPTNIAVSPITTTATATPENTATTTPAKPLTTTTPSTPSSTALPQPTSTPDFTITPTRSKPSPTQALGDMPPTAVPTNPDITAGPKILQMTIIILGFISITLIVAIVILRLSKKSKQQ